MSTVITITSLKHHRWLATFIISSSIKVRVYIGNAIKSDQTGNNMTSTLLSTFTVMTEQVHLRYPRKGAFNKPPPCTVLSLSACSSAEIINSPVWQSIGEWEIGLEEEWEKKSEVRGEGYGRSCSGSFIQKEREKNTSHLISEPQQQP